MGGVGGEGGGELRFGERVGWIIWMIKVSICMYISEKYRGISILPDHLIKTFQTSVLHAFALKHNSDGSC